MSWISSVASGKLAKLCKAQFFPPQTLINGNSSARIPEDKIRILWQSICSQGYVVYFFFPFLSFVPGIGYSLRFHEHFLTFSLPGIWCLLYVIEKGNPWLISLLFWESCIPSQTLVVASAFLDLSSSSRCTRYSYSLPFLCCTIYSLLFLNKAIVERQYTLLF